MPYAEADLLPLSALQHLLFCERQFALIHVEQVWAENRLTAEGRILHKKAHDGKPQTRDGVRTTRGLPLRSLELGLSGQADVILWQPPPDSTPAAGLTLPQLFRMATPDQRKRWIITPVEYKRGRPKKNDCDRVQLCAQALCLEEMLEIEIPSGELFYGAERRRTLVEFDVRLRDVTRAAARRVHEIFISRATPLAVREKKCDSCSLIEICLPQSLHRRRASDFFNRQLRASLASHGVEELP